MRISDWSSDVCSSDLGRSGLAWSIAVVAALSLPLGLLQVTAGSFFYIYEISDFGLYTGLFANAAHLALLLLVAVPLLVALSLSAASQQETEGDIYRRKLLVLMALTIGMAPGRENIRN